MHLREAPDFDKGQDCLPPHDSVFIPMYNKRYISKPKNKEMGSVSGKAFSAFSAFSYPFLAGGSPSSRTEKTFSDTGIHFSVYLVIIHSPSSLCQGDVSSSNAAREGPPLPVLHSTTTQNQPGPSSASMFKHSHVSAFPLP